MDDMKTRKLKGEDNLESRGVKKLENENIYDLLFLLLFFMMVNYFLLLFNFKIENKI
jgi:hypothetical protein